MILGSIIRPPETLDGQYKRTTEHGHRPLSKTVRILADIRAASLPSLLRELSLESLLISLGADANGFPFLVSGDFA